MAQHTPKPWKATTERSCQKPLLWIFQQAENGGCRETIYDAEAPDVWPLSEPNRRLIEAAPAMFEALEYAEQLLSQLLLQNPGHPSYTRAVREARAALADVKGVASC